MRESYFLLLLLCCAGCIQVQPARPEPSYQPTYPVPRTPGPLSSGALLPSHGGLDLFVDRRALQVGDLLTVRLEEATSSSKSADTEITKEVENELGNPNILGNLIRGSGTSALFNEVESTSSFRGEAGSDQSNSLDGTITVVIAEVLPNGLMRVRGEKWLHLNRGEEYVRVNGLVRQEDVDGNNTVSSLRLADARIAYSGTGDLANANRQGWLTRFFSNPLFPI